MQITTALSKKFHRAKAGTFKRQDNLQIEVGTAKTKVIYLRFYWKQNGIQQRRQIAGLTIQSTPAQVKAADARYQQMRGNLLQGITPADTESSERKARVWREEREQRYRLTVDQLFEEFFEIKKPNREPAGLKADQQRYRNHIQPIIGRLIAEDVRRSELNKVVQRLVKAERLTQAGYIARMLRTVWLWGFRYDPDKYPLNPELAASLDYP